MSDRPWNALFEQTLREHLPLLAAEDPITADLALADHGLDSLATVNLLVRLEDEYEVMIPDESLTATTFASPTRLWRVIEELLDEQGNGGRP
jgi:diaminopimelate decarboxylase